MGRAVIGIGIPADQSIDKVQIYRAASGAVLDKNADAIRAPISVSPNTTLTFIDGDATRNNAISGGGFGTADNWTEGAGWTIAGGEATHTPGSTGTLSKDISLTAGATYRIAFIVSGRTAGSVKPKLTGGTTVSGSAIATNGLALLTLTAVTGNTSFTLDANANFDGAIDDVVVFRQTTSCAAAGVWDYWVEPQNSLGVTGAISGPFTATIF